MYGGSKRGLLRPYSAHNGPVFKNLPLFGFLAGLVIFFYIFYVYQAQNAEMNLLRERYEDQQNYAAKLKAENIEVKIQLEKYKDEEGALKDQKSSSDKKYEACSEELRTKMLKNDEQASSIKKLEENYRICGDGKDDLSRKMKSLNDELESLRSLSVTQDALISELNESIRQSGMLVKAKTKVDSAVAMLSTVSVPNMNLNQILSGDQKTAVIKDQIQQQSQQGLIPVSSEKQNVVNQNTLQLNQSMHAVNPLQPIPQEQQKGNNDKKALIAGGEYEDAVEEQKDFASVNDNQRHKEVNQEADM